MRRFPLLLGGVLVGFVLLPGASRMDGAGQARGTVHQIAVAGPKVSITSFVAPLSHPLRITAGRDGALWFTNAGNDRTDLDDRQGHAFQAREHPHATGNRGRAGRCALVHQLPGRHDRADHHRRHRHAFPGCQHPWPRGIAAGPDGALWFANFRGNSLGRITTGGAVGNVRHVTIDRPWGITAGPDGALWFTNDGNHSIGRVRMQPR